MAWVQTARPAVDSVIAEVARAPAALPDLSWSHPEASIRAAGYGVAAARDQMSLRAVLSELEMPPGLPAHLPGPWLGAAAFADGLGPDWTGFSPVHFRLPALLAWTAGSRHFLAAFLAGFFALFLAMCSSPRFGVQTRTCRSRGRRARSRGP